MATNPKNIIASAQVNNLKKNADEQAQATSESKNNLEKLKGKLPESELKGLNEFCESLEKGASVKALTPEMTKLTGKYLNDSELETCSKIIPTFLVACKSDIEERKQVREELLPHVFNANPKGIDEFFKRSADASPELLLIKASYREGYTSKQLRKFLSLRPWQGVSPLQAAYLCGDLSILRKILALLLKKSKLFSPEVERLRIKRLRLEAVQQLQEIMNPLKNSLKKIHQLEMIINQKELKPVIDMQIKPRSPRPLIRGNMPMTFPQSFGHLAKIVNLFNQVKYVRESETSFEETKVQCSIQRTSVGKS